MARNNFKIQAAPPVETEIPKMPSIPGLPDRQNKKF